MAATTSELKINHDLISVSLQEVIKTRSSGKTPALFALRYLTKQIIQEHAALNSKINKDNDSSHLPHDEEDAKLKIIAQLENHYIDKLTKMGGVDDVLYNLQEYIVSVIRELDPSCSDPINNPEHRAFRVEEAPLQVGIFKTALRALLDEKTLSWSNVFHKGSTAVYAGINFRYLLAIYWLAATDAAMSMDFEKTTSEDIEIEKKQKLEFAKINFVTVLSEIRRAHNEKGSLNNPIDNPSCPIGIFGRVVSSLVMFNKLAQFLDIYKSDELINQVMLFVKASFQRLSHRQQLLVARYVSNEAITS